MRELSTAGVSRRTPDGDALRGFLGVGAWRGVVVGPVAYLLAVLRHPEGSRS